MSIQSKPLDLKSLLNPVADIIQDAHKKYDPKRNKNIVSQSQLAAFGILLNINNGERTFQLSENNYKAIREIDFKALIPDQRARDLYRETAKQIIKMIDLIIKGFNRKEPLYHESAKTAQNYNSLAIILGLPQIGKQELSQLQNADKESLARFKAGREFVAAVAENRSLQPRPTKPWYTKSLHIPYPVIALISTAALSAAAYYFKSNITG